MTDPGARVLTARWVFPITAPPIRDGGVVIQEGQILGVGPCADLKAVWPGAAPWDLGDVALLPGLVNCHTHLELSEVPPLPAEGNFTRWVVALIERRRLLSPSHLALAAEAGGRQLLEFGTTCVGEVSSAGLSLEPLLRLGLRGVVYRELLGLLPGEAEARRDAAAADLQAMRRVAQGSLLRIGLSPHSPYGLSEELFCACQGLFRGSHLPCAIHAAESPQEVEFLATGEGEILRRLYPVVGCDLPPPRRPAQSPIAYLDLLGVLTWRPLVIHAVHVGAADIQRMARNGVRVAHCPRSNAHLSRGVAPVSEFLRHAIPVGLGTDSAASASTLDLWDEMRAALAAHPADLSPAQVLAMATLGGARALELEDLVGSLEPGKRADLIAIPAGPVAASDPVSSLIAATRGTDVLLTLIEGQVRHARQEVVACA